MHDIRWIRENAEKFDKALNRRTLDAQSRKDFSSANLLALDEERRKAIQHFEQAQARRNAASKEIGIAMGKKDNATAERLKAEVFEFKSTIPKLEQAAKEAEKKLNDVLAWIPNLPLDEVPDGADEHGNVEHHQWGEKCSYAFKPKQHFELGEALGQMDFETAAKLSGARFVVLKGGLARMERALGQLFLDMHTDEHGYTEVNPPLLVQDQTMFGTTQLPKFKDDQFQTALVRNSYPKPEEAKRISTAFISALFEWAQAAEPQGTDSVRASWQLVGSGSAEKEKFEVFGNRVKEVLKETGEASDLSVSGDWARFANTAVTSAASGIAKAVLEEKDLNDRLWLIPTAEVPLTNLVRESVVLDAELPLRLTALTPCFRQEAGAAGKDTRGMIRQHQFTKVELVSIATPEQSMAEHERMLACAEKVLQKLGLHYRVVTLCAGDMGFASQKTYDIEVWLPGQNAYREISSCSVCGDFQARRMNARFKGKDGKNTFVHTLNGSGVAVGRALVAVMETYQDADGSIVVPEALAPYMGGMKKIERAK